MGGTFRLAYLATHPIQYQVPLLRCFAQEPGISFKAFFCSNFSVAEYADREFGARIEWDIPLLDGYEYEFLPGMGQDKETNFFRPFNWGLAKQLSGGRFDALWIHGWGHLTHLRAILLASRLGIPVFIRGESNLHLASTKGPKGVVKPVFLRWLFAKISKFLAIGTWNREFYAAYGIPDSRIVMVPYAVDNGFFRERCEGAERSRETLRRALNLEPGRSVILYASKMTVRKRAMDLLEAYINIVSSSQDTRPYLLFIGDGELRSALECRARETGLNSIRFLGFKNQTELPGYFDLCDVFVLPSFDEPWGLVVNEVMNAGRAVIVSDQVGSGPDLVRHKENGWIFPAGDVEELSAGLRFVLETRERTRAMGRRSREIIANWSFTQDVAGIRRALDDLLEKRSS